jgi:hypothetical protein
VDRLRQLGVGATGVNFGSNADAGALVSAGAAAEKYANKRAEMWGGLRAALKRGLVIPQHRELRDDLTGVQYGFDPNGQIQLERKQDMKRRGLASPDFGDAYALTYAYPVFGSQLLRQATKGRRPGDFDPLEGL